jgi:hypothetical protein
VNIGDIPDSFSSEFIFKRSSVVNDRSRRRISIKFTNYILMSKEQSDEDRFLWNRFFMIIITIQQNNKQLSTTVKRQKRKKNLLFLFSISVVEEKAVRCVLVTCAACQMMKNMCSLPSVFPSSDTRNGSIFPVSCFCSSSTFFFYVFFSVLFPIFFSRLYDSNDNKNRHTK